MARIEFIQVKEENDDAKRIADSMMDIVNKQLDKQNHNQYKNLTKKQLIELLLQKDEFIKQLQFKVRKKNQQWVIPQ